MLLLGVLAALSFVLLVGKMAPMTTKRLASAPSGTRGLTNHSGSSASSRSERGDRGPDPSPAARDAGSSRPREGGSSSDSDVPWLHPGTCFDHADPRPARRARYLATFVPERVWQTTVYVHPDVPSDTLDSIRHGLERTHEFATRRLNLSSDPPAIYVYPTVDALRQYSCTGAHAVAYYDGAIHLALVAGARSELLTSLRHEYVHHVLVSNGIRGPIWFQEGAAMTFAGDRPANYWSTWRENPIRIERMVSTFPSTESKASAEIFYAQAFVMMEFLERLCLARTECGLAELAAALASERVTPERLFDWASEERSRDLAHTSAPSIWNDYAARGDFSPKTLQALLDRAR